MQNAKWKKSTKLLKGPVQEPSQTYSNMIALIITSQHVQVPFGPSEGHSGFFQAVIQVCKVLQKSSCVGDVLECPILKFSQPQEIFL